MVCSGLKAGRLETQEEPVLQSVPGKTGNKTNKQKPTQCYSLQAGKEEIPSDYSGVGLLGLLRPSTDRMSTALLTSTLTLGSELCLIQLIKEC